MGSIEKKMGGNLDKEGTQPGCLIKDRCGGRHRIEAHTNVYLQKKIEPAIEIVHGYENRKRRGGKKEANQKKKFDQRKREGCKKITTRNCEDPD